MAGRSARPRRGHVDRRRRGRTVGRVRQPHSSGGLGGTRACHRGRLDERAAGSGRGHQYRPPARVRARRRAHGHEHRADRRRDHAARPAPWTTRRGRRRRMGHHVDRPAHVRGCAAGRGRRHRGLPARVPPGRRRRARPARRAVPLLPEPRHLVEPRAARCGGGRTSRGVRSASPASRCERHDHRGWASLPDDERDRQSKRNFYRIIDRFGSRRDLLLSEQKVR